MNFTDLFIKRPILAAVVSSLILLVGLRCALTLPVDQFPKLENTVITITTNYPGATQEVMQGFITQPLEQAVASADGLDYMTSSTVQGQSLITVYVRLNFDSDRALTEVMSKVQQVKYLLPKDSEDPSIDKESGSSFPIMYMGFYSEKLSVPAISDYLARSVQPLLLTVPGVASAQVLGQTPAMRLWLSPDKMAARGITADDVTAAIQANNFQAAPGQTKNYFTVTDINADTDLTTADGFSKLVVKSTPTALVRIEDIGTVELGSQAYTVASTINQLPGAFIVISPTPDGNPLTINAKIEQLFPGIVHNLPPSLHGEINYDASVFINASIQEVLESLVFAIVVVIIVIFLFLGSIRSVAIPVVSIPLSLIGASIFMTALGFSLNLLTMLAMVLAIGLVVDDAIVVMENIHRWIERGKTPVQAAILGTREIFGPIVAMTITLAAVYAPLGFQTGLTGTLFREFAFTLASAVIISGIVAVTLSPMMCSLILQPSAVRGRFEQRIDRAFEVAVRGYGQILGVTLNNRGWVGLFLAAVLGSAVFMTFHLHSELAPPEDEGFIFLITKAPANANVDYQSTYGRMLADTIRKHPEVAQLFQVSGLSFAGNGPGQGVGGLLLKPWGERASASVVQTAIQNDVTSHVPGISAFLVLPPSLPGSAQGMPVEMVVTTLADYPTLFNVMEKIKAAARASGLFIVTDTDLTYDSPVIRLHVDRAKASALGLTMQSIGDTLAVMAGGNYANLFALDGRSYQTITQVPRGSRFNPADLTKFYVNSRNGTAIPLSTIVSVEEASEPSALPRYNQQNSATFSAVPLPSVPMGDAVNFLEKQASQLPVGFSHDYLADSRQYVYEGNSLLLTFPFAIIIIYLVLAAQFESLRDPLVILVTVPLAISGALLPLFFWVVSLNLYSEIGLITLIGLISKHGILMVEFAGERQILDGLDRISAIRKAAAIRLRPILMTTAAMVIGLLPLLLSSGAGAASRRALGMVIVSGMTIGTLFTLFVLPTVYTVVAMDRRAAARNPRIKEIEEA